jgi:hypothetical protein
MEEMFEDIKSEYSLPAVVVFFISLLYLLITLMVIFLPGNSVSGTVLNILQGAIVIFFYGIPLVIASAIISIVHIWMSQKKGILISALGIVLTLQYILWLLANVNGWEVGPIRDLLLSIN